MEVKEAIALAKQRIQEVFADEQIGDIGLEEVEFDDDSHNWLITIGFSRPWTTPTGLLGGLVPSKRDYKVVRISDRDGKVSSIKAREFGR